MARIPVESEAAFGTLLTSLTEDTVTASIHWRLCKDLWASVPEFVGELNQSPAFWTLTFNAHREVALFRLGRLYDQQNGGLAFRAWSTRLPPISTYSTMPSFASDSKIILIVESLARSARRPDDATLAQDAASVSEKSDLLVRRLLSIRNRVLAHRDPRVVLGTVQNPSNTVDNADIDALLDRAATIIKRYGIMFRAGSSLMSIVGQDDFRRVLEHVRRDLAAYEKQIAEEVARTRAQVAG
jgi:AbiU2